MARWGLIAGRYDCSAMPSSPLATLASTDGGGRNLVPLVDSISGEPYFRSFHTKQQFAHGPESADADSLRWTLLPAHVARRPSGKGVSR